MLFSKIVSEGIAHNSYIIGSGGKAAVIDPRRDCDCYLEIARFDGWVIHGHHHNNDLRCFPFVNFKKRWINVSAEVLGYSPVGIQELMRIIREHECSGNREPILLRYPYIRQCCPPIVE